jgi:hypothetical protein
MWNLVSVRLEIVLVSMQERSTVCAECTIGSDWMHPMVLLGDKAQVETCFGLFLEIVLILKQDRCTVCAESTIGSKTILDAPDGTHR